MNFLSISVQKRIKISISVQKKLKNLSVMAAIVNPKNYLTQTCTKKCFATFVK